ncbi:MAG TPA: SDR family oxidoreductase [Hyphomicrobiaceae bacterium]|nr:SDR family oxidoreductase [Hyphomicrobiaceae bacterium]
MQNPLLVMLDWWLRRYWAADPARLETALRGKPVALISGASEGIGLALAHRFAAAGHNVVLVARRAELLEKIAAEIASSYGVEATALPLDLALPDAVERIAAALAERQLYVDVLVNNAGLGLAGPFLDHDPAEIDRLLNVNVKVATALMRRFLPDMCVRGRGGVLNVSSLGGYTPGPYQATYYASRGYLIALTRAVGFETRGQGVRVAVVAPGPVNTRFHSRMGADNSLYRWLIPPGTPEGVARAAVRGFRWGKRVIMPGLLTWPMALAMHLTPAVILVPVMGLLLQQRGGDARR